jgi:hypothetical protein
VALAKEVLPYGERKRLLEEHVSFFEKLVGCSFGVEKYLFV